MTHLKKIDEFACAKWLTRDQWQRHTTVRKMKLDNLYLFNMYYTESHNSAVPKSVESYDYGMHVTKLTHLSHQISKFSAQLMAGPPSPIQTQINPLTLSRYSRLLKH